DAGIAYDDVGSGLPVVFLHAFPLNRTMWDPQVGALVAECRCIPIDMRGLGDSAAAPPYSMDRYADDVAGVLDVLQIERAVVCGLSMGGYVAFALWRRHRERVRALVLADTQIAGLMGKTTRARRPDIYDAVHRMIAQAPTDGIVGALEAMIDRPDSTKTCATIDVPTLVVVGDEDVVTPPKEARRTCDAISGSRLEVLAQAGHLSSIERPAAFNTVVSEFLASLLYN